MVGPLGEDAEGRGGMLEEQIYGEGARGTGIRGGGEGGRGTDSWGLC